MKPFSSVKFWVVAALAGIVLYGVSCVKDNQVITTDSGSSSSTLISLKTTSAPTIDGVIDALWSSATKLTVTAQVPDPGYGTFAGYIGNSYDVTLRSLYDANNIYILAEWNDPDKSLQNTPVSYNPTTKLWSRQAS